MANTPITLSGSAPAGDVSSAYSWTPTISTPGSFTVILASGALPPGLSLSMTTGTISGTPTSVGTYAFSLTLISGAYSTTTSFVITTNAALTLGGAAPAGKAGVLYQFTPTISGGSGQYTLTVLTTDLGLAVDGLSITGRPLSSGTLTLKVKVSDGLASVTQTYLITVEANTVVTITNQPSTAYVGESYLWTPVYATTATDPVYTVSILSGSLPDGLYLDEHSGIIEGVASDTTVGTFSVEVSVGDGETVSKVTLSIVVVIPITLTGVSNSGYVGSLYSQTLKVSGGSPSSYAFTLTKSPNENYFPVSVDRNGIITGTPLVSGTYLITVSVTDGYTTAISSIRVLIRKPVALSGVPDMGMVGVDYAFTPVTTGGERPFVYSYTGESTNGISFDTKTGSLYGIPENTTAMSGTITVTDALKSTASLPVRASFGVPTSYVIADRPEQFSGYLGVGTANYTNVLLTDPNEFTQTGYMTFTDATVMPTTSTQYGKGCAWTSFKDANGRVAKLTDCWICATVMLPPGTVKSTATDGTTTNYTEEDLVQYSPMVLWGYDSGVMFFRADPSEPTQYRLLLATDITDPDTYVDTLIRVTGSTDIQPLYIRVSGGGLSQGQIAVYTSDNKRQSWDRVGTWSGNLLNYGNFYAVSYHNAFPGATTRLYYTLVSNYPLTYAYVDRQTASALGTEQDWTGKTDTLALFPTTYNLVNGLHTSLPNQTVSFVFGKTAPATDQFTLASAAILGSFATDSDFTEAPIVAATYDTQTKKTSLSDHQVVPGTSGGVYNWIFDTNPETGSLWTDVDLANTEFGFKRIPPAGTELALSGTMGTLFYLNNTYDAQFSVSGGNIDHYLWSAQNLPQGMTIDQTGYVTGVPTKVGTWNTVISVDDGASVLSKSFVIYTTLPINLQTDILPLGYLTNAYSWTPTVLYNPQGAAYTITQTGTLPHGVTFDGTKLTGSPSETGDFSFTLTITDGTYTNSQTYSLSILTEVAVVDAALPTLYEDVYFKWQPTVANARGPLTFSYEKATFPDNVFMDATTGLISGTPTSTGNFTMMVTVSDGISSGTTSLTAVVKPSIVLTGPTAVSGTVGSPLSWEPTITNVSGTVTLSVTQGVLPAGLSIDSSSGVITGSPVAAGKTTVTITANDGHTYDTLTVVFTVSAS